MVSVPVITDPPSADAYRAAFIYGYDASGRHLRRAFPGRASRMAENLARIAALAACLRPGLEAWSSIPSSIDVLAGLLEQAAGKPACPILVARRR